MACSLCSTPAFAYVDPGASLLALQGLLALIGGMIVLVRHPLRTLKSLWERLGRRKKPDA